MNSTARIVRNIESLMAKAGLNQAQLAREAKIPATTLNRLMLSQVRGAGIASSYSPTTYLVDRIAKALGVTVATIISPEQAGDVPIIVEP